MKLGKPEKLSFDDCDLIDQYSTSASMSPQQIADQLTETRTEMISPLPAGAERSAVKEYEQALQRAKVSRSTVRKYLVMEGITEEDFADLDRLAVEHDGDVAEIATALAELRRSRISDSLKRTNFDAYKRAVKESYVSRASVYRYLKNHYEQAKVEELATA